MKKILILTGPGGAGKTTIANLLKKNCGFALLDGDYEDSEFFPEGKHWLPSNSKKLHEAHKKILLKAKKLAQQNSKVVIDYIIFGHYLKFFKMFKNEFGENLEIIVLFPRQEKCIERDLKRECWTTGSKRITAVYSDFEKIKNKIGAKKFIDSSEETPKKLFEKYFKC